MTAVPLGASFKRGDTIRLSVTLTDADGDPYDYTAEGATVRCHLRPYETSSTVIVPDQDTSGHAAGVLVLTVDYEDAEAMTARRWVADVEVTVDGVRVSSATFWFDVIQDVTWPEEAP